MTTDADSMENPPNQPVANERRHLALPALLFLATCLSTLWAGASDWNPSVYLTGVYRVFTDYWSQGSPLAALEKTWALMQKDMHWQNGWLFMSVVMGLLLAHEMGHFLMTLRHRIPASLPFFIPLPIIPFGTLGAVISMEGSRANRRELFDLGIAGPLAGLAVTLPIVCIGILQLPATPIKGQAFCFHNPLLLQYLIAWLRPGYSTPDMLYLNQFNPFLMAGWVGLLITGLNMLPISQLDGGHVAYGLLGRRAHTLARTILVAAILYYVVAAECYPWILMLILVILLGTDHPTTADDQCPLGWWRKALGWASLLIPILCFPVRGITPPGW